MDCITPTLRRFLKKLATFCLWRLLSKLRLIVLVLLLQGDLAHSLDYRGTLEGLPQSFSPP